MMHDNRLRVLRETAIHISSPGVTDSFVKGIEADPDITVTEWTKFFFITFIQDLTRNEQYQQYRDGLISEERWRQTQSTVATSMTLPGYRAMYPLVRPVLGAEYQALLDGIIKDVVPIDPSTRFEIWKSLAQARAREDRRSGAVMTRLGGC